ncbi:MAG TPA: LysE family translocator [Caulobacteraceae bacterium]|nr:LysE family translocator [Caulobacteraceae bacterium]
MTLPVDPARYGAFLVAMFVMAITPGPANVFSVATGMQRGKAAALLGVVGMNTATLVWFVAAALGLGALVAAFPEEFKLIAVAGGLYVGWLGLKALIAAWRDRGEGPASAAPVRLGRSAFLDGFAVQIANPKIVLFFAAVLPPFLDVNRPMAPQLAMFAAATIGMDLISMSAYGLGGAALSERMTEPKFQRGFGVLVGVLLLVTAALILTRR